MTSTIPHRPNRHGRFLWLPSPIVCELALGNGSQYFVHLIRKDGVLFLAIEGCGAWHFDASSHFSYVMEKLRLCEGDAQNMADFIADQLETRSDRQGNYERRLCT